MMRPMLALLLSALGVHTFTTFQVPAGAAQTWPEAMRLPEEGPTTPALPSTLSHLINWAEEIAPQPAISLGLHFDPGPQYDFSLQEMGMTASVELSVRYFGAKPITILESHLTDPQLFIESIEFETYQSFPFTLRSGQTFKLTIQLFPRWIGVTIAQLILQTNLGTMFYVVKATVQPSVYHIKELVITAHDSAEVGLYNPMNSPMFLVDVFKYPSNSPLKVLPFWDYATCKAVGAGDDRKLTVVSTDLNEDYLGMIVILTNNRKFAVPVTIKSQKLQILPEKINFGIVTAPDVRHMVSLHISNFEHATQSILSITASDPSIHVHTYLSTISAFSRDTLLADLVFSLSIHYTNPTLIGQITIVTNTSRVVIPFVAFSGIGVVNYDPRYLTFSRTEASAHTLSMSITNATRPIRVISATSQTAALSITSITSNSTLTSNYRPAFRLEVKGFVPFPQYSFLALETALGVISFPVWFQKVEYTCTTFINREPCKRITEHSFGWVPVNDTRSFPLKLSNFGQIPLQMQIKIRSQKGVVTRARFVTGKVQFISLDVNSKHIGPFYSLSPGENAGMEVEMLAVEGVTEAEVDLLLNQNPITFKFSWRPLKGEFQVFPHSINLPDTFIGQRNLIPLILEHSFQQTLTLIKVSSRTSSIQLHQHHQSASPFTPTHVYTVQFPKEHTQTRPVDYSQVVTITEIREGYEREEENRKKVQGIISIETDLIDNFTIPFSASFKTPQIAVNLLDFGQVSVAGVRSKYLKVSNPSDYLLLVQLLLFQGNWDPPVPNLGHFIEAATTSQLPTERFDRSLQGMPIGRSQYFYLSPAAREITKIKPHESVTLGPIYFAPEEFGGHHFTLYIRNNLTVFSKVDLKGVGSASVLLPVNQTFATLRKNKGAMKQLRFEVTEEMIRKANTTKPVFRKVFTLWNAGNQDIIIHGIKLDGKFCALREVELEQCGQQLIVLPNETFDVTLKLRLSYPIPYPQINLVVIAESANIPLPVAIIMPNNVSIEYFPAPYEAVSILSPLLATALIVLLSFIHPCHRPQSKPLFPRFPTFLSSDSICQLLPTDRRKTRKRRRRKADISSLIASPQPVTSGKEEPTVLITPNEETEELPQDLEREEEGEERGEEEEIDDSDEGFLDDYRETSGLFMGFQAYTEEER